MHLHFDWTITPSTIISMLWLLVIVPSWKFIHNVDESLKKIMEWMRNYPPHIHDLDDGLRYAPGMGPERRD